MNNVFTLIMAGGSGTRFWPRSRDNRPKQFLKIFGDETLIQNTINRFLPLSPKENIFVVSKIQQKEEIEKQKLTLISKNILFEPVGRNTLPCIGLAAMHIQRINPEGIIVVSPSDHLIDNLPLFRDTVNTAIDLAQTKNSIVTIGITPTRPATGYGYVNTNNKLETNSVINAYKVNRFVEKPSLEKAKEYLQSGDFYWNSGLFVFKCSVLIDAIQKHSPEIYKDLKKIQEFIDTPQYDEILCEIYPQIKGISIDYAIMEKSDNLSLVQGDFLWSDLGGWEQVYELSAKDSQQNATIGNVILEDTTNSYIYSPNGLTAVLGLDNILVIKDGDATLVCSREKSEEIRKIVEKIKIKGFENYL